MKNELKDILVIDIETVTAVQDYGQLSERMQKHWDRKATFLRKEEDQTSPDLYFERGGIYAEFGKVIVIAVGFFHEDGNGQLSLRVRSFSHDDEKLLLSEFIRFIEEKFDQRNLKLCGHNGKEFDFPYLCRRMIVNRLRIPDSLNIAGKKPWEVNHIDTMELWKFGDRKNFTSLDLLAALFDIPSSKSDIDGSQVNTVYYNENNGLERIAHYCKNDVVVTAQLFLRLKSLPLVAPDHITII